MACYEEDNFALISIHVPRVEDDGEWVCKPSKEDIISIHVPRVEDDMHYCTSPIPQIDFNPRPPCGGRPAVPDTAVVLREFQSTSPVWRTTYAGIEDFTKVEISIHVPRVEDDSSYACNLPCIRYFNPRPPCGGRRSIQAPHSGSYPFQSTSPVWRTTPRQTHIKLDKIFQSTSPVWRTTKRGELVPCQPVISIHVPRVEDDFSNISCRSAYFRFQSTSPVWRTT